MVCMDTIRIGTDGPLVPPVAVGTMYFGTQVDPATAREILDVAVDAGATFLDTANNYAFWVEGGTGDESEETLGAWFASRPGVRDRVTVATKVGARPRPGSRRVDDAVGLSAPAVRGQVEDSLRRLRTDHVEVLYAHIDDTSVPIEETVGALQDEVRRGTAGMIGCSNISVPRLRAALAAAGDGPRYGVLQQRLTYLTTTEGADLSPHVLLEDDLIDLAAAEHVALVGYSPLLSGAYTRTDRDLPGAYRHAATDCQLAALAQAGEVTGLDAGQVVLAWMAARATPVIPVVGVSSTAQLGSAVEALSAPLPDAVRAELEAARVASP